jgi:hypothetical protein
VGDTIILPDAFLNKDRPHGCGNSPIPGEARAGVSRNRRKPLLTPSALPRSLLGALSDALIDTCGRELLDFGLSLKTKYNN